MPSRARGAPLPTVPRPYTRSPRTGRALACGQATPSPPAAAAGHHRLLPTVTLLPCPPEQQARSARRLRPGASPWPHPSHATALTSVVPATATPFVSVCKICACEGQREVRWGGCVREHAKSGAHRMPEHRRRSRCRARSQPSCRSRAIGTCQRARMRSVCAQAQAHRARGSARVGGGASLGSCEAHMRRAEGGSRWAHLHSRRR